MRIAASFLVLALLTACGHHTPKATSPLVVGKGHAATAAADVVRAPSDALLARWPVPDATSLVYVDAAALAASDVMRGVAPAMLANANIPPLYRACLTAGFASVKEILVAQAEEPPFVALRVDGDAMSRACAPLLAAWKPASLPGATSAWTDPHDGVVAFGSDFVLAGARPKVEAALAGTPIVRPALHLETGEVIAGEGVMNGAAYTTSLLLDRDRLRATVDLKFIEERAATQVDAVLGTALTSKHRSGAPADPEGEKLLAKLQAGLTHARSGKKLHAQIELVEAPAAQAADVVGLANLAVSSVRDYIANAKVAEARNVLGRLAKEEVSWYESEQLGPNNKIVPPSKKRLFSVGPTPKTIPRGMKYQSTRDDWKPWDRLRFELDAPQYFQYEIKAAKDGKSAEIIARGDLNGDGKSSQLSIRVEIRKTQMWVEPSIREVDIAE